MTIRDIMHPPPPEKKWSSIKSFKKGKKISWNHIKSMCVKGYHDNDVIM